MIFAMSLYIVMLAFLLFSTLLRIKMGVIVDVLHVDVNICSFWSK